MKRLERKLMNIYELLLQEYGPQGWWPAETPFEVLVGAVLTQNTSWRNVEKAIQIMKENHCLSEEGILKLNVTDLAKLIKCVGFYNVKARRLKNLVETLVKYGGMEALGKLKTEELRLKLLAISGIGKETADSIILYAFEKPIFVVDEYTRRILTRLEMLDAGKMEYDEIRTLFENNLPQDVGLYKEYHALLVKHAKEHCKKKPRCEGCVLIENAICKAKF